MPASPELSSYYLSRQPSVIRLAQIEFAKRNDNVQAINTAIGNVSLPMHPAMQERMNNLGAGSPFEQGVVKYTASTGSQEANNAFLNIISACGFDSSALYSQVTDGASHGMELTMLGACRPSVSSNGKERPLLLIDPAYTNYNTFAARLGCDTISVKRRLGSDGKFSLEWANCIGMP